jgi:ABC-2 type transport system permease protein
MTPASRFRAFRVRLLGLVAKELRQTVRDRRMIGILMIAPMIQLLVLGHAVNLDVDHVPILVADEDRTAESRDFLDGLTAGDAFRRAGEVENAQIAQEAIAGGRVPLAAVLPRGFAADLAAGRTAQVQLLVDGGDSNRAIVAQNAAQGYVLRRAQEMLAQRLGRLPGRVRVEPRVLYNPSMNSRVFFVPGVAATLLLVVTLVVTAMGFSREKESGTLEQIMVTPLGGTTLFLGKTLPYALIGLLDLGLVLGVGTWVFGVPLRGPLAVVFLGGSLYLMTLLGGGLLLGALARTQQQALVAAFFLIMPAILLSGFASPIENMPGWLQPFTLLNPVRHMVEVMRAVLLRGAGLADVAPQLVALGGLGLAVFTSSAVVLRRRLA